MIQLEPRHWEIVSNIFQKYPYQFYAYGSRVKGTARKYSDLDLCYYDDIPDSIIFQIKEKFEQSNLPFQVELVAWKNMNVEFQELIKQDLVKIF